MESETTRTRWERSLAASTHEWASGAWKSSGRERRASEWDRHLRAVGLGIDSFEGQAVLDVGCGPTGLVYFADAARRVGLDPCAKAFADDNGYWGEPIELIEAPAEDLPFGEEEFDAVFCVNVLDHTHQPARIVEEIARVLKSGGTFVTHMDLDSPLRKLHKRLSRACAVLHPHSLGHEWLTSTLAPFFSVDVEVRDPEVFRARRSQMRYEAYWDGLLYRRWRPSSGVNRNGRRLLVDHFTRQV